MHAIHRNVLSNNDLRKITHKSPDLYEQTSAGATGSRMNSKTKLTAGLRSYQGTSVRGTLRSGGADVNVGSILKNTNKTSDAESGIAMSIDR